MVAVADFLTVKKLLRRPRQSRRDTFVDTVPLRCLTVTPIVHDGLKCGRRGHSVNGGVTKSSFHYKCCVCVFHMLSLKFAGNVIDMLFSTIKLQSVHDPQNIKTTHVFSHENHRGCVQTSKMLDNNIICCCH